MAQLLRMPEVSADAVEAILQEWAVHENDTFAASDTIATIETDKAVVDVEAETDGTLLRVLVAAGSNVAVGAPIALVGAVGESVSDIDALLTELGVADAPSAAAASSPVEVASTASASANPRHEMDSEAAASTPGQSESTPVNSPEAAGRVFASPLARKLARESAIALESLSGSGPNGRIRRRDVESAIASRRADASVSPQGDSALGSPAAPAPTHAGRRPLEFGAEYTDVEHSRLRKAVAVRLTQSKQVAPHFYVRGTANADRLIKLRARINASADTKVSFNDLILKAVAVTHTRHPEMNAIWTDDAMRMFTGVDVAVAIASDRGLVTPVLRQVESLSVTSIAAAVQDLAARANEGQLRQNELEGGSISVSNLGMFDVEEFSAIINPPQSAILAVGAIREEPVVRKGKIEAGKVLHFVLSVDHRAVDGAMAAEWMRTFSTIIENPIRMLV